MKSLLVTAALFVGASNTWAETITYDFKNSFTESSLTKNATAVGYIAGSATAVYYPTELSSELNNIVAFQYKDTNEWSINKSRGGLWSYAKSGNDENFSICNLQAGDIVTITLESGEIFFSSSLANATYDNAGVETTPAQWSSLVSGTPYKIKGDGKLDLQAKKYQSGTRDHMVISKIVIERSFTRSWGMDFITLANNLSAGNGKSVTKSGSVSFDTYYNITDEGFNTNFGINDANWQVRANSKNVGLWPYNLSSRTMAIQNLTRGQFVVFWGSAAVTAGTNAIKVDDWSGDNYYTFQITADGVATFSPTNSSYIYSIGVYDYNNEIVGAMDKSSGFAAWVGSGIDVPKDGAVLLQFKNHGTNTQNYYNWCLGINNASDGFLCNIRADWAALDAGGAFTYGYASSTDGGDIAGSVNWDNFKDDLQDADVSLNLTYKNGKLYITGTTTKDDHIYYFNFTYGDGSYAEDKWIVHPFVEKAWLEITSKASTTVRTNPVHATAINAGTIATTGYNSFASTYPLNLGGITGATAYYVTASDVKSTSISLTEATEEVVAGTGLILNGTAGTAVTIPISDAGSSLSGNKLVGCTDNTDITASTENYGNFYVLSATEAAFKNIKTWVDKPNTLTIPAGKAYLDATGIVTAPSLTFDFDGTTGIDAVKGAEFKLNGEYIDLQGRKMAQPTKGLYIMNGKKVVIK